MYEHLPKKIVYLRHPQCLHNIAYQEAMDQGIPNKQSPLTPLGEQQRDITAAYLKKEFGGFDAVFSSTFIRTHTIPAAAGWLPQMYSLLDERSNGVWHHMPRSAVLEKYPDEEIRSKTLGYYHYRAPEGESCPDVELRLQAFLEDQNLFTGLENVLISGHGTAGLCFRRQLLGGSVEDWHAWDRLKNASVTVYERNGDTFACTLYNFVPWEGILENSDGSEA